MSEAQDYPLGYSAQEAQRLADQGAQLEELTRHLRPGAIVALQELDMSQISQVPASELFMQARRWILEAFGAGGAELDMGTQLYTTFLHAGLPAPNMMAATPIAAGQLPQDMRTWCESCAACCR